MKSDYDSVIQRMERKEGNGQGKSFHGGEMMALGH